MHFSSTSSFVNSALKGVSASSNHHKEQQGGGVCVCVYAGGAVCSHDVTLTARLA